MINAKVMEVRTNHDTADSTSEHWPCWEETRNDLGATLDDSTKSCEHCGWTDVRPTMGEFPVTQQR